MSGTRKTASPPRKPETPRAMPRSVVRRALILLSQGMLAPSVGDAVGVSAATVRVWAKANADELAALVKEHEARVEAAASKSSEAVASSVVAARAKLAASALRAAEVLEAQLDHDDPAVAAAAARTLLDRVGVPRTERVETAEAEYDFSALSAEERALLRTLLAKAEGAIPTGHA